MHISNEQKDFNDCLELAADAKLTVAGNEFHMITILFPQKILVLNLGL